jgi:Flp pilus assembly pilin Flp
MKHGGEKSSRDSEALRVSRYAQARKGRMKPGRETPPSARAQKGKNLPRIRDSILTRIKAGGRRMLADCSRDARPPHSGWTPAYGTKEPMNVQNFLSRFLKDGSGATSIEYAFIACGVAVAIFIIIGKLSVTVESKFEQADAGFK